MNLIIHLLAGVLLALILALTFNNFRSKKEISKWSKVEIESAEKIPEQLKENPFVGKQLRYPFLREKRIKEKRVYYLIYEDLKLVLVVAASGKKDQQVTIDHIISQFDEYRKVAEQIAKQVS